MRIFKMKAVVGLVILFSGICFGEVKEENLISNGGFEEGELKSVPKGWSWYVWHEGEFQPSVDTKEKHSGERSAKITGISKGTDARWKESRGAFFTPAIPIKPKTFYVLTFWYKGNSNGLNVLWIGGTETGKEVKLADANLAPTEEWKKVEVTAYCDQPTKTYIYLRNFEKGEVWFDDVCLKEASEVADKEIVSVGGVTRVVFRNIETNPVPELKEVEGKRGYLLFERTDNVYPNTIPTREEIKDSFKIFATPGEVGHFTFAIYPLKELGNVKIDISDLFNVKGDDDKIGKTNITAFYLKERYKYSTCKFTKTKNLKLVPEVLIPINEGVSIEKDKTKQIWVKVNIPENTKPGFYEGEMKLITEDGISSKFRLGIRVLPFKLEDLTENGYSFWAFYYPINPNRFPYFGSFPIRHPEDYLPDLLDMKEIGMTRSLCSFACTSFTQDKEGIIHIDFTNEDAFFDAYKKAGMEAPVVFEMDRLLYEIGSKMGMEWKFYESAPVVKPEDVPEEVKKEYKRLIKEIAEHGKEKNWPELLWYPVDEITMHTSILPIGLWQMKAIKEVVPGAKIFCTVHNLTPYPELAEVIDVMCYAEPYVDDTQKAIVKKNNAQLWTYVNPIWMTFWINRKRGFSSKKVGAISHSGWAHTPYPLDEGDFKRVAFCFSYIQNGKYFSTIQREGMREGIYDARYILTLEKTIEKAKKSGKKRVVQKAEESEKMLKEMLDKFPPFPDAEENYNKNNEEISKWRWKIALKIMELQEEMK